MAARRKRQRNAQHMSCKHRGSLAMAKRLFMIRQLTEAWCSHAVGGTAVGLVADSAFAAAFALALLFDCGNLRAKCGAYKTNAYNKAARGIGGNGSHM